MQRFYRGSSKERRLQYEEQYQYGRERNDRYFFTLLNFLNSTVAITVFKLGRKIIGPFDIHESSSNWVQTYTFCIYGNKRS